MSKSKAWVSFVLGFVCLGFEGVEIEVIKLIIVSIYRKILYLSTYIMNRCFLGVFLHKSYFTKQKKLLWMFVAFSF